MAARMSDAELDTLGTAQTSYGSNGSDMSALNGGAGSPPSRIIVSDNDEDMSPERPRIEPRSIAATSVSRMEAHPNPTLESACQEGDINTVERLLTPENLNCGGLHHAAANNHWRICKLFLARGADVNHKLQPVNAAPISWAARHGHVYIVKLLLDHGADPLVEDSSGFSLLHLAVHSSNVLMVVYIVHLEASIDKVDVGNRTPLHWAIVQGDHLSVDVLLKSGASSNLKDGEGASPLQLAAYNSQSEAIVALLLQHDADPTQFSINTADPPNSWSHGCKLSGRLPNGTLPRSRLSPELAKLITTFFPAAILPLALSMPTITGSSWIGVPAALLLLWQGKRMLERYVIPLYWHGPKAIIQSTLLAGAFVAIFALVIYFWLVFIAPVMIYREPLTSIGLFVAILTVATCYFSTMYLDPGKIEPKSMAQRLQSMDALLQEGLFDSTHVCIRTFVPIPARAQYDFYLERVICRYDHYCPWLYNAIGVRNHRPFMLFLLALGLGLPFMGRQYFRYTQLFGSGAFSIGLCIVVLAQSVWVYALLLVQVIQISRGLTSHEASHANQLDLFKTDPLKAYSSLPHDHPKAADILGDSSSAASLLKHSSHEHKHRHAHKAPLWARITGFSQLCIILKLAKRRLGNADYGTRRNCMDFWLGGGPMLRPEGTMGCMGGVTVDYSTLSEIPGDHRNSQLA